MKIELLYFDGCPSWQTGLNNLQTALQEMAFQAEIELTRVRDDADATRLKFLGSPSFLVNGVDLWPEQRDSYSLSCRVYPTAQGVKGWPTVGQLRERITSRSP